MPYTAITIIISLLIAFYIENLFEKNSEIMIKADLERKGCQKIIIHKPLSSNRHQYFFIVEYHDKVGVLYKNKCMVYKGLSSDGIVYWEKPSDKSIKPDEPVKGEIR